MRQKSADFNQRDLASESEIHQEVRFFGDILHCYDAIFGLLRKVRQIFTPSQISDLKKATDRLKVLWPTKRSWEKAEATCTPKGHDIWYHVILQLQYLGRFYHFMEDPIEKLHKEDKLLDRTFCHLRSYEAKEEAKAARASLSTHPEVRAQIENTKEGKKRKFTSETIKRKTDKGEAREEVKAVRRSFQ